MPVGCRPHGLLTEIFMCVERLNSARPVLLVNLIEPRYPALAVLFSGLPMLTLALS